MDDLAITFCFQQMGLFFIFIICTEQSALLVCSGKKKGYKEDVEKSMKNTLCILWHAKKHLLG